MVNKTLDSRDKNKINMKMHFDKFIQMKQTKPQKLVKIEEKEKSKLNSSKITKSISRVENMIKHKQEYWKKVNEERIK